MTRPQIGPATENSSLQLMLLMQLKPISKLKDGNKPFNVSTENTSAKERKLIKLMQPLKKTSTIKYTTMSCNFKLQTKKQL